MKFRTVLIGAASFVVGASAYAAGLQDGDARLARCQLDRGVDLLMVVPLPLDGALGAGAVFCSPYAALLTVQDALHRRADDDYGYQLAYAWWRQQGDPALPKPVRRPLAGEPGRDGLRPRLP